MASEGRIFLKTADKQALTSKQLWQRNQRFNGCWRYESNNEFKSPWHSWRQRNMVAEQYGCKGKEYRWWNGKQPAGIEVVDSGTRL